MYGNNPTPPVKEGEELDVKIEAIGDKGDGIAKKNGFVLVIPNTQVNDEVKVRVTKVLRKVGFAEVIGKAEAKPADDDAKDAPKPKASKKKSKKVEEEMPEEEEQVEELSDSEDFGDEQ
jgi:predicted RNA-binding protein with TRAM domain